jgi:hypothetical protein
MKNKYSLIDVLCLSLFFLDISFANTFESTEITITKQKCKKKYIPELGKKVIINGTITWSDGYIEKGKRAYIPELKQRRLVDGEVTIPDGITQKGKWAYIPELKKQGRERDSWSRFKTFFNCGC